MPQQSVASFSSKLCVDEDAQLHPPRLRKRAGRRDWRLSHRQRSQTFEQASLVVFGNPAFELSRVDNLALLVAAEIESIELAVLFRPSGDEERVAMAACRLEPVVVAA